ncbi:MAG: G5 domain-containing protein [Clostridia bacterium]|nr:G5 domain-containing protein [Clostridia bacterium]
MKNVKIICASIILVFLSGAGVIAMTTQRENIKITLANGYEMTVPTSKTKVADILAENKIIVAEDEKVSPDLSEDVTEGKTITITNKSVQEVQIAKISEEGVKASLDDLLNNYTPIVEKRWTEQVAIPFETVTKNAEDESEDTKNRVVQEGEDGIKEVTYRAKFQNDVELEGTRTVESENVVKEPVDKIVQVQKKVTARASTIARSSISGSVSEYVEYAQAKCYSYGWTENDVDCLVSLWNRESGWNPNSYNASSGAYGIPQALPASKMASAGSDYMTNYKTQINWGIGYIKSRYGSPSAAWAHSQRTGWY